MLTPLVLSMEKDVPVPAMVRHFRFDPNHCIPRTNHKEL